MWSKVENQSGGTDTGGTFGRDLSYAFTIFNQALSGGFSAKFSLFQSDTTTIASSAIDLVESQFNHLLGIADGSKVYFYINGSEVWSDTYDGTIDATSANFKLETLTLASAACDSYVDEVSVWKDITFDNDSEREAFVEALWNNGDGMFWLENIGNWDACTEYASSESSESEGNVSSSSSSS